MSFKIECNRCQKDDYIQPGNIGKFQDVNVGARHDYCATEPLAQLCPDCVVKLKIWLGLE